MVPPLVQLVRGDLPYALVSLTFGVAIASWGVPSRVRRRLAAGALAVLVTVVLVLGLPLAHAALAWDNGPASAGGLWLASPGSDSLQCSWRSSSSRVAIASYIRPIASVR